MEKQTDGKRPHTDAYKGSLGVIEHMFDVQKDLQGLIYSEDVEKIVQCQDYVLGIISQVEPLMSSAGPWRRHTRLNDDPIKEGVVEEAGDILKYLINILLVYDITPKELIEEFDRKTGVVIERFVQSQSLREIREDDVVVVLDLDEVLVKCHREWLVYLNHCANTSYLEGGIDDIDNIAPTISRKKYYKIMYDFIETGGSLRMSAYDDARRFGRVLRERNYKVVIVTSRDYKTYRRQLGDTYKWLRDHYVTYDGVLWGEQKHKILLKEFRNVRFVVEDHPENALKLAKCGFCVYLMDKPYNQKVPQHVNIQRVHSLTEVLTDDGYRGR